MDIYYKIIFFIFGAIMGSFFHVVATRLAKGESITRPSSHCHNCNHKLKFYELIPILSYIIQKGRSRCCHQKLPISYLMIEIVTGVLFAVCFHVYDFSYGLIIALIFISALITVIVSDIEYMIILDEVLYVSTFLIVITYLVFTNFEYTAMHIYAALGSFGSMYIIKIIGDYLFKRESLGGGDIKLMFLFGLVLGFPLAISTIFLATFLAFPIALYLLYKKKDNMIPFGPFLSIAAMIIFISGIEFREIIEFII